MLRRFCTFLVCAGLSSFVHGQTSPPAAKPDTSGEAIVFERISNLVRFEEDGTGLRDTTAIIRVQSQAGIQQLGQLVFGYSSATEKLEVDYVRVRKPGGQVVETPTADAQDFAPEILREAPSYTDYRQRHVSVVGLQPGDVLEYHTIIHVTAPLAPHQFWYEHAFPRQAVVQEDRLEIDIPKAREVKLKSPAHKYEARESGDRRIYTWVIRDFAPDRKRDREEPDESDDQADVQISTFADWQQVAHWYAKLQGERVVNDSVRKQADELTKGVTTPEEKTRRLYDYVARNIRYVSLSFGIGRLQPHAASEVLQNGFGDCKDKHTLLEALLRAEGIQSYPVLIDSSRKIDPDVPSPAQFDHEITAVRLGNNKDANKDQDLTWLDTTAEVAPYGLIMYQLRNKQALIASDDSYGGLHRTPADSPVKNFLLMKMDGKFTETGAFDITVDITAQGDSDLPMRASFRQMPQADWQRLLQFLSGQWGLAGDVSDIHLDSLEDTTKPFHLTYHYHKDNYFAVPNAGVNFQILPPLQLPGVASLGTKKSSEPINVGPATERTYRAHIEFPSNYTIQTPPAVKMTRDYGEYSSSYNLAKNVLNAERRMVLKVNELPASRRADYDSFRNVSSSNQQQVLTCSVTKASGAAVAAAGKVSGTPEEIRKAGTAALQRRDFSTAVDLLNRAVQQDANLKDAWDDLGRAYAGLNNHEEAVRAFRKQIELEPFHARANSDLAGELQQQGKFDDAIVAYRKQIEINPGDKLAHKQLGLLLAQLNRQAEAQTELEAAAAIPPDDPEVKIALAQLYARGGNQEKAGALMKSVTGSASMSAGSDVYASALRDDIDPNQTVRDARQTLSDIGDQFDSGEYDRVGPSTFSAMNLVALAWARLGWAKFKQGETLEAMQFLNSAWLLSQSGTVGNRLARLLEKEGQRDQARHTYALAVAAGGAEVEASRQAVARLSASPAAAEQEIAQAPGDLLKLRTVPMPILTPDAATAHFALVFDGSSHPERTEFIDGDAVLNGAGQQLQQKDYPVKFPDVSSVKIIRRATVSCGSSKCAVVLLVPEAMSPAASNAAPGAGPKR